MPETYWVPRWHMPFPTLPTISGKRPASRRARRMEIQRRKNERYLPQPNGTMREYARLMALSPEEAARDEHQRLLPARYGR